MLHSPLEPTNESHICGQSIELEQLKTDEVTLMELRSANVRNLLDHELFSTLLSLQQKDG